MPATYKAQQQPDGKWTIFSVPVFGELPENSEKGNSEAIGRKWMRRAIAECTRRREQDGYRPPLHAHHHGWSETRPAGHFSLTAARTVQYDGEPMVALFADLIDVPEEMFQRIQDGEFPYRSVEIFSFEKAVINSIALLDDVEPFFRFPNLDGKTLRVKQQAAREREPILFSASKCEVIPMKFKIERVEGEGGKYRLAETSTGEIHEFALGEGVDFGGEPDERDEEITRLKKENDELKAKLGKLGTTKPTPTPVEVEAVDESPAVAARFAAMEQRLDKNDAQLSANAEEKRIAALVAGAEASLKGWHITDKTRERLVTFATAGENVLNEYVEAHKSKVPKETADTADPEQAIADAADDPVMAKFAKSDPAVFEKAKEGAALHAQLVESGMERPDNKEGFIHGHILAAGLRAAG